MAALLLIHLARLVQGVATGIALDGDLVGNPAGGVGQARGGVLLAHLDQLVVVHGVFVFTGLGHGLAEGSVELLHGVLLGVHQVEQLQRGVLVGCARGDGGAGGVEFARGAVPHGLVRGDARGGRHRDGDVLVLQIAEGIGDGAAEHHAGLRSLAVTDLIRVVGVVVLGGPLGGNQALGDELVVVLDDFLVFIGGQEALDHAVLGVEAVFRHTLVEAGDDAGGVEQQHRAVPREIAAFEFLNVHRDLVRLAVAVRILGLERLEHVLQLVPRGRHLQTQLVKPGLVDQHMLTCAGVGLASTIGYRINPPLGVSGHLLGIRLLLKEGLDVRQLVKILAQILKHTGILVSLNSTVSIQVHIRDIPRGQGGVLLLGPSFSSHFLPLDLAIAVGLQVLGPLHVGDLVLIGVLLDQNRHNRLAVSRRGRLLIATRRQRTQQGHGAYRRTHLHRDIPHCLSFESMMTSVASITPMRWTQP